MTQSVGRVWRRLNAATFVVAIAFAVTACNVATPSVSTSYRPTVAGVVASRDLVGAILQYRFSDGRAFSTPLATRTLGVQPDVGALLLSGTDPEPWLVATQPRPTTAGDFVPAGCFSVPGRARSDGRTLFLHVDDARGAIELAVPVAAAWVEPKHRDASDELTGTVTCLNDRGQATLRY